MGKEGYEYCTTHWCLREETESLFVYPEQDVGFNDLMLCDLPFGDTNEEFIGKVSKEILLHCGEDIACILDTQMMGIDKARTIWKARSAAQGTCNPVGGECDISSCCDGLKCVETDGFSKECAEEEPTCQNEWGSCAEMECCDKDATCVTHHNGLKQCRKLPSCMSEWEDCSWGVDCCGDMVCQESPDGRRQCVEPAQCVEEWMECNEQEDCCGSLKCLLQDDGRKVCKDPPTCVAEWNSCAEAPCCQDGPKPLACVESKNWAGLPKFQCMEACVDNTWDNCSADKPCCDEESFECKHPAWGGPAKCMKRPTCVDEVGGECSVDSDCCDGLSCNGGTCKAACVDNTWEGCSVDKPCCDEESFECKQPAWGGPAKCIKRPTCIDEVGGECSVDSDCCEGLSCNGGSCEHEAVACITEWDSCAEAPCCQDGDKPLACVEGTNWAGLPTFKCKAACVDNSWEECSTDKPCCDKSLECQQPAWGGPAKCVASCVDNSWEECSADKPCCDKSLECKQPAWGGPTQCLK